MPTNHAARRVVKSGVPLLEGLETVHHRPIVTVRRRGDEEQENPGVKGDETPVLVPSSMVDEFIDCSARASARYESSSHLGFFASDEKEV